jgi:hypothetical protein
MGCLKRAAYSIAATFPIILPHFSLQKQETTLFTYFNYKTIFKVL